MILANTISKMVFAFSSLSIICIIGKLLVPPVDDLHDIVVEMKYRPGGISECDVSYILPVHKSCRRVLPSRSKYRDKMDRYRFRLACSRTMDKTP